MQPLRRISVIAALLSASAPVAFGDVSHNEISGTFFNQCTGETMLFHGVMHVITTDTTDAAGGEHHLFKYTFGPATNVGLTTGNVYQAQSNFTIREATLASGVYETSLIFNRVFQGHGDELDWNLHWSVQVTVNAEGLTVSDPENMFLTCR